MTTLDYIKQFEGKNVLVLSKHESIYIGEISEIRRPTPNATRNGTVAIARFNHQRICNSYNPRNPRKFLEDPSIDEDFPCKETDKFYDITPAGIIEFLKHVYKIER